MKTKARGMVMGSFAGDALALGAHWIYDTAVIDKTFGRIEYFIKPSAQSYHPTKEAGAFTHYGDQTLVLLESLAHTGSFSLEDFARRWQGLFSDYDGYVDGATTTTLKNFASGKSHGDSGSQSTDLGGAARIAPLIYAHAGDLKSLLESVRAQTAMTHNSAQVAACAEFFARVTHRVLQGQAPVDSMKRVAEESFASTPLAQGVADGLDMAALESRRAIFDMGQSCAARSAFPSTVQLIARYENDLREGLIENVMAGGDSAARGLVVGMVLGAHLGMDGIPEEWMRNMKLAARIVELLERLDGN